ncbi:DUF3817 domain-containing protein [Jatrophihabitans fulvus]
MNVLKAFRIVAVVEAVSWLLLIVATIVKYTTHPMQETGVKIMGPVHGLLFVVYVGMVLFEVRRRAAWDARTTLVVLVESVIPGGGFLAAKRPELQSSPAAR